MRTIVQEAWTNRITLLLLALAVAAPQRGIRAQEEERIQGNEVSIYNLAGRVEVVPGNGSDVTVRIMRGGSDAERLEVSLREVDGRQALVVRYPESTVIYPELGRGSRSQIRVRSDGTFGDRGNNRGDQVEIRGSGRGLAVNGDLLIDTGSGAIHARGGSGSLNVDTGSGEVSVEEFQGDLLVDTGSGGVDLTGIQGGEVNVDTGSGAVRGSVVSASYFKVDTGSGEIVLSRVSAPEVYLDTGSGEVDVELLDDVDELLVDTGSGGVTIRVPATVGAEIEVDTGSGGIDVDIPVEVREVKRNYMLGILGDGRGRIVVDTGPGGVRLIGG